MPHDMIAEHFASTAEQALERFKHFTRSAAFSMNLGIREIRLLHEQPWGNAWAMQGSELAALHKLIEKGLLEHKEGEQPHLSEAGRLVRQLLCVSRHIALVDVAFNPLDVLRLLQHATDWHNSYQLTYKRAEMRTIDGEDHLVVRVNDGTGYSEWAIPRSAVRRIG